MKQAMLCTTPSQHLSERLEYLQASGGWCGVWRVAWPRGGLTTRWQYRGHVALPLTAQASVNHMVIAMAGHCAPHKMLQ